MKSIFYLSFFSIILFSSCKKEEITTNKETEQVTTYQLGEEHAGGIIIQLNSDKTHGLVVAKTDQVTYNDHLNWNDSKAQVEAYSQGGTGWRLPTKSELELIYQKQSEFNLTGFASRNYWSSNVSNGSAWSQYFGIPGGLTTSPWKQLSNCTLCSRGVKEF